MKHMKRKQEIEEKHRLHLTNVKAAEENKSLYIGNSEAEKHHAETEKKLRLQKEEELGKLAEGKCPPERRTSSQKSSAQANRS
jgi:sigma-E controlled sporulation protein